MPQQDLSQLVRILPEPAFLMEASGLLVAANDALAELHGTPVAQLVGTPLEALVADAPQKVREALRLWSRSRQRMPGALRWRASDGRIVELRCDGAQVVRASDAAPALIFVQCRPKVEATDRFTLLTRKIAALSREIFERKRAEQQRDELLERERRARLEAERLGRIKDEFLATLSHELRTPIHAILGWTHVLLNPAAPLGGRLTGLRTIERNARAQARIIDDLLDMSRIVSGKVELQVQPVAIAAVIEAAIDSMRPAAQARSLRLEATLEDRDCRVRGDPERLQQVVWNLLSNAVKFTPRGGRVQVRLACEGGEVRVVVSDDGEGIAPDFLPHVFDRFRQADASTTRRHGGLGLGLSIVQQIVELHGGSVRAESPGPGQGASFTVRLPALRRASPPPRPPRGAEVPATAPAQPPAGPSVALPSLQGMEVLVVDDQPDARELLRVLLESRHASVHTAASAADALELVRRERPHLLLCDIGMPAVDGCQLLATLRGWPAEQGGRTPALAFSAFVRTEDRLRALDAGFDGYLVKPVEIAELFASVAQFAPAVHTEAGAAPTEPA